MDKVLSKLVLVCALVFILSGCGGGSDGSVTNPGISGQPNNSSCFDFSDIVNGQTLSSLRNQWRCVGSANGESTTFNFVITADGAGLLENSDSETLPFIWGVSTCNKIEIEGGGEVNTFNHIASSGILSFKLISDGQAISSSCVLQPI